ncbi:DUF1634 domain-containing protein [Myroides pelagicus]|uniref:DUF1634 domain-containing protein n=1 Tax=Myroides pelagicus TaxID=270914 RepID=A0A7K1GMP3_9FLAO|nr:DUF1634 domain-containing protein [Myroides pelagicus]MEC4114401.1 DUF1634 domain-containing protein [Myroides pelagicus]MTH30126.1 DUF1634 domain-containing protein [Myroides pelagicus]
MKKINDIDLQTILGNVLRYGVWTALSVALLGGVLVLFTQSNNTVDFSSFIEQDHNLFQVIENVLMNVSKGNGEAIIFLGILLLFLTPALRLVLSLVAFILEKDWMYVIISLIVIGIITLSVSLGFSH